MTVLSFLVWLIAKVLLELASIYCLLQILLEISKKKKGVIYMSSLNAFLNPPVLENKKVVVSKRFKDEETQKPAEWEIRPITSAENDILLKKHIKKDLKKGTESFDKLGYQNELVIASVVFPNLHDAKLQNAWGVLGANQLIGKMLLIGEFTTLASHVQEVSGLDPEEDLVEEAKN